MGMKKKGRKVLKLIYRARAVFAAGCLLEWGFGVKTAPTCMIALEVIILLLRVSSDTGKVPVLYICGFFGSWVTVKCS
ncbi:hypothetical protein B9Z19DRAFT_1071225 [Tuber borchii]|uniref:Uncharacterized protein n=1 Tax=Tuber borchii TaxID=42251 RepID=A0A2T7A8C6_TUBBO|nr:hypothetical protein B9Z19DRAFT_1071225 [Tuber borchii]